MENEDFDKDVQKTHINRLERLRQINSMMEEAEDSAQEELRAEATKIVEEMRAAQRWMPNEKFMLMDVPIVEIDLQGVFKYVMVDANQNGIKRTFIRGSAEHKYHYQIAEPFVEVLSEIGAECNVVGGGWIERTPGLIFMYGISYTYGPADHHIAAKILKAGIPAVEIRIE
eukprot:GHVO01053270.1.p1 GENE.GHVO01053270.1~~GHVO01053270.1.p1  ORF type:complete len:180 (+),score=38.30 GHVO01053270.1:28-540(+)